MPVSLTRSGVSNSSGHVSGAQAALVPETEDVRRVLLQRWLSEYFGDDEFRLQPASADASFRRYFRVTRATSQGEVTWIAMDAPVPQEDI